MFIKFTKSCVQLILRQQQQQQIRITNHLEKRFKHKQQQYQGVKGIRSRKSIYLSHNNDNNNNKQHNETLNDDGKMDMEEVDEVQEEVVNIEKSFDMEELAYDEVVGNTMHVHRNMVKPQNVIIIQPYVKWTPKSNLNMQNGIKISPNDQLREAEALIKSIPNWHVAMSIKVPLENLERKMLFGSGKLEELKQIIHEMNHKSCTNNSAATLLFVSKSQLTFMQKCTLEQEFNLPVMDRYSIVIQILRLHATSAEAKLQVAMAEIPYIWSQAKEQQQLQNHNKNSKRQVYYSLTDNQRDLLRNRERKLRQELVRIRNQRVEGLARTFKSTFRIYRVFQVYFMNSRSSTESFNIYDLEGSLYDFEDISITFYVVLYLSQLLRHKRQQKNYPVVAIVGYTNTGKTSFIKALTHGVKLQPKDKLFATLDVTAHSGMLPCKLEVIYMDTIGFMSDLPTGLFECFIATLEDVMLADVIVHVQDVSHECWLAQCQHVQHTLMNLAKSTTTTTTEIKLPHIINVGNKIDLLENNSQRLSSMHEENVKIFPISSLKNIGLDSVLNEIECEILKCTNRLKITMRVRSGGSEMSWLYKNSAVVDIRADDKSAEHLIMNVVITEIALQQFKRNLRSST